MGTKLSSSGTIPFPTANLRCEFLKKIFILNIPYPDYSNCKKNEGNCYGMEPQAETSIHRT
ncbi:hypothetical protein T09_5157 [Trichinella sp. T9]|nr:hypothetical protein T09_5157 [Trichinella sp. T9]